MLSGIRIHLPAQEMQETQGSIPGSGRCPEEGSDNSLQYSCLENFRQRSLEGYSPGDHKESDTMEHAHTHARRVQGPSWVTWVPPSLTSEPPCLQKLSTLVSLPHSQGLLTPSETQNTASSSEFLRPEPWSLGCPPRPASTQGLASSTSVLRPASSWPSSRLGVLAAPSTQQWPS